MICICPIGCREFDITSGPKKMRLGMGIGDDLLRRLLCLLCFSGLVTWPLSGLNPEVKGDMATIYHGHFSQGSSVTVSLVALASRHETLSYICIQRLSGCRAKGSSQSRFNTGSPALCLAPARHSVSSVLSAFFPGRIFETKAVLK